jgi:hypothetical protein
MLIQNLEITGKDRVMGCTRNKFFANFCNNNDCTATDVLLTLHLPEEVEPNNLNGFVATGQIITHTTTSGGSRHYRVYTKTVNFDAYECRDEFIEGVHLGFVNVATVNYNFYAFMQPKRVGNKNCTTVTEELSVMYAFSAPIILNGNASNYLGATPNYFTYPDNAGRKYLITNDLLLNAIGTGTRYFFNEADYFVLPDVRIVVQNNAIMSAHAATFKGCDAMWDGVVVENGGQFEADNKIIFGTPGGGNPPSMRFQDAKFAIDVQGNGAAIIDNTKFIDNYVGIRQDNSMDVVVNSNTSFSGTGTLKPANGLALDNLPYAGILTENNSFTDVHSCQFTNMANGILATNSSVSATRNNFEQMQNTQNVYPRNGFGIRMHNFRGVRDFISNNCNYNECQTTSIYTIGANVSTFGGSIKNTPTGILANRDEEFSIGNVAFDNASQGINAIGNNRFSMNIAGNTFTKGNNIGIGLRFNTYPTRGFIRDNNMTLSGTAAISSQYATYGESFEVTENRQIHFSGTDAIRITDGNNVRVNRNFDINLLSGSRGIFVEGGNKNDINCNIVNNKAGSQAGMRFDMINNPIVSCNQVNSPYEAVNFRFDGQSPLTLFNMNVMNCTNPIPQSNIWGQGLLLKENAIIGIQKYRGNCWNNSSANNENVANFALSTFIIYSTPKPCFRPKIDNPYDWFKELPLSPPGTQDLCEGTNCPIRLPLSSGGSPVGRIFTEGINSGNFSEFSTWIIRRQYFDAFKQDPSWLALGSNADRNLMQELESSDIGRLYQVAEQMNTLYKGTTEQESARNIKDEAIRAVIEQVKSMDNTYHNSASVDKLAFLQQRATKMLNLRTLYAERAVIETEIKDVVKNKINALEVFNNSFGTELLPAQNEQKINALYLKVIAREQTELNSEERSNLTNIAFQCPFQGGNAVYRARAIYDYVNGTETVYPEDCDVIAPRLQANQESTSTVLYPNPAGDYVMLNMPESDYNKTLLVSFVNMQGMVVLSKQTSAVEQISTAQLSSGFYTCVIKDSSTGATLKAQKIIIAKN